jgi:AcrR family transcriptional regulator
MVEPGAQLLDQELRGQVRRQQILDAAAACFVREGFHGASIVRIAKAAGMSAGNLYHFFACKEAMIAALVQRRLDQSLALFAQIENAEDLFQAMMERVEASLYEQTDPDNAALELEILAEAARNPVVATIVRAADAAKRERLRHLYRAARQARGLPLGDEIAATEVMTALFQGLPARALSHPDLDRAGLVPMLRLALATLF